MVLCRSSHFMAEVPRWCSTWDSAGCGSIPCAGRHLKYGASADLSYGVKPHEAGRPALPHKCDIRRVGGVWVDQGPPVSPAPRAPAGSNTFDSPQLMFIKRLIPTPTGSSNKVTHRMALSFNRPCRPALPLPGEKRPASGWRTFRVTVGLSGASDPRKVLCQSPHLSQTTTD